MTLLDLREPARYPLDAIMAQIWEDIDVVPIAEASESDPRATWHKGSAALFANDRRPPSYVWFRGNIEPGAPFKGDIGQHEAVAGGIEVAFVHCWGGSEDVSWAMQHNLVSAARERFGDDCVWRGSQWNEPDSQGHGAGFIVTLAFKVPVIAVQFAIAVPEDVRNQAFIRINGTDIPATGA